MSDSPFEPYRAVVEVYGQAVPASVHEHRGNSRYVRVDPTPGTTWEHKPQDVRCFWISADFVEPNSRESR